MTVHSIQVGAFPTEEAAEHFANEVRQAAEPRHILPNRSNANFPYRVVIGNFPNHSEAWVYSQFLNEDVFPDSFIAAWEWDGRELKTNRLDLNLPFDTTGINPGDAAIVPPELFDVDDAGVDVSAISSEGDLDELTDSELLAVGAKASSNPLGREALRRYLANNPGDEEWSNYARLRLAQRYLGARNHTQASEHAEALKGSSSDLFSSLGAWIDAYRIYYQSGGAAAYDSFVELANDTSAHGSARADALRMAAGIAHSQHDYPTAFVAFELIERLNPDAASAGEARMQRTGLLYELVGRGRGSWSEVRTMARSAEEFPSANEASRATARLMYLETFFEEKNFQRVLREADALVEDYSNQTREVHAARYWKARAYQELLRHDDAIAIFDELADANLSSQQVFPALDVRSKSLYELGRIHRRSGNDQAASAAESQLVQRFPNSEEARRLESSSD